MKKAIIAGAIALSTLALGGVAFANSANPMSLSINNNGSVELAGKVTAISGNTVSVSSWLGTWSVNAANATILPANSTLADVKVGDTIKVSGTLGSGMSVNATVIKNKSIKKQTFVGTISNLNTVAGTFILTTEKTGNVTVATNANTKIWLNGAVSALTNVTNGMKATVQGSFNVSTNVVTADSIKVPALELRGNHNGWFKTHAGWNNPFRHFWED